MTLKQQVTEFHTTFNVAIRDTPSVPDDATVRLRLRLIAEEFFELLSASIADGEGQNSAIDHVGYAVRTMIDEMSLRVDLPEFADALADLDYVIEGSRLAFGIDGAPIAAEVHRANLAKVGGPVDASGKIRKPASWTPPDIAGCLRAQGWKP